MDRINQLLTESYFYPGDVPDAWQAWYDDSCWERVSLPHDWAVSHPFSKNHSSGTGYLPGGIGWYRIHIKPDPSWENKHISITFDGIYKNSRIWCNSYYLGERPNGYISFTHDITHCFHHDTENIISIYVDHRDISDSRWFTGSGITRNVTLHIQEPVHAKPNGIFFTTPQASAQQALCCIANELENTSSEDAEVQVTNYLLDKYNHLIASAGEKTLIKAGAAYTLHTSCVVKSPTLWSPESPYLYTLKTTVQLLNAPATEKYTIDTSLVGIRKIHFTADSGFYLNDVPTTLKGVCVHHDAGCLGAAVPAPVWERRLKKLKEMGCNAIRMSHNPHAPQLYALCDAMGFFVIDEAFDEWEGAKNKWSTGHNVYPPKHQGYFQDFPTWHEQDLVDMIRRDRNHPSILLWSIGNEIDYPNDPYCHQSFSSMTGNNDKDKPIEERKYNPLRPDASRLSYLSRKLSDIVKTIDNTRPVTLAAAFPELSATIGFLDPIDVVGYNYKEHLYEESHARFPEKPFFGSENNHSLDAWNAVRNSDYIFGQFLWTGIDFLGEAKGWPIHGSGAGLLTLAGFEKTTFYRRQSFWSGEPMVHLCTALPSTNCGEYTPVSENWNYRHHQDVLVKCYTNLPKVELYLNDAPIGVYEKPTDSDCIEVTIPFEPGILRATGVCSDLNVLPPSHTLMTTGCACSAALQVWKGTIHHEAHQDLYQLEITMQDAQGNRVYTDSTMLHLTVDNGKLLGLENGDLADNTEYSAPYRRAYRGQLLAYIQATSNEPVTVTVQGDGIEQCSVCLSHS